MILQTLSTYHSSSADSLSTEPEGFNNVNCGCSKSYQDSPLLLGSPQLEGRLPPAVQPYHNIPYDTKLYRDFAAGGYVESDNNLAALREREAAEARSKQLDDENFAALFRDQGDPLPVDKTKMTLVRRLSNGKGLWKGVYESSRSADPSKKEETSLLD